MTVRYRYPGGEWAYHEGDSFTSEILHAQCYAGYEASMDIVLRWTRVVFDDNGKAYIKEYRDYPKTVVTRTFDNMRVSKPPFFRESEVQNPKIRYQDGTEEVLADWFVAGNIYLEGENPAGGKGTFKVPRLYKETPWGSANFFVGTIDNVRYTPLGQEDPECATRCVFKIFLDGELVFEDIQSDCPEVEIVEDECPEGTCEVICGDTMCCYGSDGVSVHSFSVSG